MQYLTPLNVNHLQRFSANGLELINVKAEKVVSHMYVVMNGRRIFNKISENLGKSIEFFAKTQVLSLGDSIAKLYMADD